MKTLQTGTKVLIEATVERPSPYIIDEFVVALKSGATLLIKLSDLTVCETAEVDIPAPQQIEVGDVIIITETDWVDITTGKEYPIIKLHGSEFVIVKGDSGADKHIYIGTPGHFEIKKKPVTTPSFKAGQEVEIGTRNCWIRCKYIGPYSGGYVGEVLDVNSKDPIVTALSIRPIPAQPTVEQELLAELEAFAHSVIENPKHSSSDHLQGIMDIFNRHQKHSGRVEVSVPSDEEIEVSLHKIIDKHTDRFEPIILFNDILRWTKKYFK